LIFPYEIRLYLSMNSFQDSKGGSKKYKKKKKSIKKENGVQQGWELGFYLVNTDFEKILYQLLRTFFKGTLKAMKRVPGILCPTGR